MKKHVCAAALALCFVLAACAPEPGASSASVPSSSAAASSLPPASGTAGQAAPAAKRTEWHVWSNTVRDFFVPVHSFSGPPPAAVRCVS